MDLITLTETFICGFIFIMPLVVEIFNDRKEKISMTIIFDNEEQKKKFMGSLVKTNICPSYYGLCCYGPLCTRCWEQALEIEVKEKKNE